MVVNYLYFVNLQFNSKNEEAVRSIIVELTPLHATGKVVKSRSAT